MASIKKNGILANRLRSIRDENAKKIRLSK